MNLQLTVKSILKLDVSLVFSCDHSVVFLRRKGGQNEKNYRRYNFVLLGLDLDTIQVHRFLVTA